MNLYKLARPVRALLFLAAGVASGTSPDAFARNSLCGYRTETGADGQSIQVYDPERTRVLARGMISEFKTSSASLRDPWRGNANQYADWSTEELPQRLSNSVIPTETECVEEMTALRDELSQVLVRLKDLQVKVGDFNMSPSLSDTNSLATPDPRLGFKGGKLLKKGDGVTPVDGATDEEKLRNYLAEHFERMARVFVAGSAQLERDTGASMGRGCAPIQGMYQGYMPDLLASKCEKPVAMRFDANWGRCQSGFNLGGVANLLNESSRWFRGEDGSYRESSASGRYSNHRNECKNVSFNSKYKAVQIARGQVVESLMTLMKSQAAMIRAGRVPSPEAFGVDPVGCRKQYDEIVVYRDKIRDELAALQAGVTDPSKKGVLECEDQSGGQLVVDDGSGKKMLGGLQSRTCHLASAQSRVELQLVLRYAYCTWRVAGQDLFERLSRAMLSMEDVRERREHDEEIQACHASVGWSGSLLLISLMLSVLGAGCKDEKKFRCSSTRWEATKGRNEWVQVGDLCGAQRDEFLQTQNEIKAQALAFGNSHRNRLREVEAEIRRFDEAVVAAYETCREKSVTIYGKEDQSDQTDLIKGACIFVPDASIDLSRFTPDSSETLVPEILADRPTGNDRGNVSSFADASPPDEAIGGNVGGYAQGSAATGGGSGDMTFMLPSDGGNKSNGSNSSASGSKSGSAGQGRRGVAVSSGSGMDSGFQIGSTAPNPLGADGSGLPTGADGAVAAQGEGGGAYSSGSSGSATAGAGGAGNGYGNNGAGGWRSNGAVLAAAGGGGTSEMGFGPGNGQGGAGDGSDAGRGLASVDNGGVPIAGTSDPEDYFTRTDLGADLFAIVKKKYSQKAANWVMEDARLRGLPRP